MQNLIVKNVDMFGDTIMAAQDKDGNIWAGINFFCRGLGMSKRQRDFQVEKVKADKTLSKGCTLLRAGVLDQANEVYALKLDFVPIWLSKITITKKMDQETPDLAEKLLQYQLKAKDILAAAFLPNHKQPKSTMELLELHYQALKEVSAEVDSVKEEVRSLKEDLPILPLEQDRITKAARAKGVAVMGGKQSGAYKSRSIINSVYRDIYGQIYRNFGVTTYKAIKRSQCDKVLEIIEKYEPPVILADRIADANAQLTLDGMKGGAV